MAGQTPGFDDVYREHSALVYNFLLRLLGNPEDAEDAAVETFRRVHSGLRKYRGEASLNKVRLAEVRHTEIRPAEVRPAEVHPVEVLPVEIRPAEFRISVKFGHAPPVPRLDALFQNSQMFFVRHGFDPAING